MPYIIYQIAIFCCCFTLSVPTQNLVKTAQQMWKFVGSCSLNYFLGTLEAASSNTVTTTESAPSISFSFGASTAPKTSISEAPTSSTGILGSNPSSVAVATGKSNF